MKDTFILTKADLTLLDIMQSTIESRFTNPLAGKELSMRMDTVWEVLGEKHNFIAGTAEKHPEGEPKILAVKKII